MHVANVIKCDMSNGPGMRVTVFVSGCTLKCVGCFNTEAKHFKFGKHYEEVESEIFSALADDYISGLSILGGDPCEKANIKTVTELVIKAKELFPNKPVWVWTGRLLEDLQNDPDGLYDQLLATVDVLIDGPFIQEQADKKLKYTGSKNQRIINLKELNSKSND